MSTSSNSEAVPAVKPSPGRGKAILVNLGLSCVSLLVFVGLVELALRLMGYGNVEIYQADPLLYWRLKPNQRCYTKVNHQPVRVNSLGTRGAEFSPAKPANTIRIVSLGDSRTFGWGLSESETYSGRLESLLREHLGSGKNVEVINAGVNGWSFPQMTVYFREHALRYQPDFVIVGDGNLWTQFSEQNSPEFVRKFMLRVRLKNLLRRFALYHYVVEVKLSNFYERYRMKFVPIDPAKDTLFKEQQQKDPAAVFRNSIEQICTLALSNRVAPVLMYLPTADEADRPMQKAVREAKVQVSERLHVPLLDVTSAVAPRGKSLYLDADPVHFNAEGNEIISRQLFQTLTNLVAR